MGSFGRALATGTALQTLMVIVGHLVPAAAAAGLFPIGGTLIGLLTGWLAGTPGRATFNSAKTGGVAGGVAGTIGSLVSTMLGDVPLTNVAIAGGSTIVTGALGALLRGRLSGK